jgi:hypothetical protein
LSFSLLASKPGPSEVLLDVALDEVALERAFHEPTSVRSDANQLVACGTSGCRGPPLDGTGAEVPIRVIAEAIVENRPAQGYSGPLVLGKSPHAIRGPALGFGECVQAVRRELPGRGAFGMLNRNKKQAISMHALNSNYH